jgi:hypothetical protein
MEEWQRQQKVLKDADRQQKKGADNMLKNYRGTQQAAWDRKQKELKAADRHSRDIALSSLKSYRGGEHDIKEYERMVAKYRLQLIQQSRERHREFHMLETESSTDLYEESWQEIVEQHIKEFEQMAAEHGPQQIQGLKGSPRWPNEEPCHDAFADAHCQDFMKNDEFINSDGFPNETKESGQVEEQAFAETYDRKQPAQSLLYETKEEDRNEEEKEEMMEKNQSLQSETGESDLLVASPEPQVDYLANIATENKRLIELDFSFGLIYGTDSPPPSIETCSTAAARIVPVSLGKTLKQTLPKAIWDSNFRAVVKSVNIDPTFERQGANRYVVKGTVPIHISVGDISPSSMRILDGPRSEIIVGRRDEPNWRRVRKGECPSWSSILTEKMGTIW